MRLWCMLLVVSALSVPAWTRDARAQDDWSIKRERPPRRPSRPSRRQPRTRPRRPEPSSGRNRTEVLIARYRGVLESKPGDSFALRRLLDLYRERDGNIDGLVEELERERRESEDAYGPRLILGQIFELSQRTEEAVTAFEEAHALEPDEPAPLVALARIHRERGDLDAARDRLEQALEHTRRTADRRELLRDLGEIALEQNDYDAARGYYDRLMRGAGGSLYLRTEYARALEKRGEHERAVKEYERVLSRLGGDKRVLPPILRDMGRAQLQAGRVQEAIATLERGLRLAPAGSGIRREIYDVMVEAYRRGSRLNELADRLEREARGFESLALLGRVHDELGNEEEALEAYRRALRINRRHIDTRVRVIQLLSRSGRLEDVIDEYRTLIRIAPREPRFVVELAQLLMQIGRRDEAMRLAARTSRRYPREPTVHQALAELYGEWGEDELATREIRKLVRIDPRDPSHLIVLGSQQLAEGDKRAAIATWRRILATEPDRARAYATLGGVFADHDLLAEAEEAYREAVRRDPDELAYVRGLANVLERPREGERASERRERDEEAVEHWRKVLELADDDRAARREARKRIVGIAARRNALSRKLEEWRRAFRSDPPDVEAGRFLAEAYLRQRPRRLEQAEEVLARIVQLEPGDVESLSQLERVHTAQGELAAAIDVLRKLVEADPRKAPHYLQRMAEHSLSLYRDDEAVEFAERAVQRTPDDAAAHRRLGDLYRARQDIEQAIASYRRAIELNERLFPTYFDLAELHLARGELEEADRLLRRVMRASPDDDLVARATRASIQIHVGSETLEKLERDLLPLALSHSQRPVYRRLVVELYDAMTRPWIAAVQQGGSGAEKAREKLHRLGNRAIKPLLEALSDPDPAQRRIAIDILGHLGNENAAGPLLAAAEGEGDAALRARALAAAGALADPSLADRMVALAEGSERRLRAVATWSLARMGGRRAVSAMRDLLTHADPAVRAFAALGLGRAGDGASAGELARLGREDRNTHVKAAAAWALGRLEADEHVSVLVLALGREPGLVSRASAQGLGRIGGAEARAALARALFDPEPGQRRAAARALVRVLGGDGPEREASWFPVPEPTASVGDYVEALVDRHSAGPLGPVDLAGAAEDLKEGARDALAGPVERVLAALAVLTPEGEGVLALGPLTAAMDEWPEGDREATREVLRQMAAGLREPLVERVDHPAEEVRERVVALLGRMDHAEAARALVIALGDAEPRVQRRALAALRPVHVGKAPELGSQVAELTQHPQWSVRMHAAEAIGRLRVKEASAALVRALEEDDYAFVREAAARALGRIGGTGVQEALREARASDPEPRVREAATAAVRRTSSD